MTTRIAGVLSVLMGLAALVIGAWGFSMTEEMTQLPAAQPFDARHWSLHWRTSSVWLVTLGLGLGLAGSALLRRKRWGFMLLMLANGLAALLPWLLFIVGFSRYAFEQPSVLESAISLAVGVAALLGYRRFEAGSAGT